MFRFFRVLKKAASDFSEDDCMSTGAAIAYYAIFSLPPLLVLIMAIAGYFGIEPDEIQKMVQSQWGVSSSSDKQCVGRRKSRDGGTASRATSASCRASSAGRFCSSRQRDYSRNCNTR